MLDKTLCDDAIDKSKGCNNRRVTIYRWIVNNHEYDIVIVENDPFAYRAMNRCYDMFGDPIAWGFSH